MGNYFQLPVGLREMPDQATRSVAQVPKSQWGHGEPWAPMLGDRFPSQGNRDSEAAIARNRPNWGRPADMRFPRKIRRSGNLDFGISYDKLTLREARGGRLPEARARRSRLPRAPEPRKSWLSGPGFGPEGAGSLSLRSRRTAGPGSVPGP